MWMRCFEQPIRLANSVVVMASARRNSSSVIAPTVSISGTLVNTLVTDICSQNGDYGRAMKRPKYPNRLGEFLKKSGKSQTWLAEVSRTTKQQISKLVAGERKLTRAWAEIFERHLMVPWPKIMGYAPDEEPPLETETSIVYEYDVRPAAGGGAILSDLDGDERHPIIDTWSLPTSLIRSVIPDSTRLAVIRVAGDSMEPEYRAGERLLVDLSHRQPTPPGVYVLWDGLGVVLKHVELLLGSEPPTVRLKSVNPIYETYERLASEVVINGRVVGRWQWR